MPTEERPASANVLWTVTVPPGSNRQVPLDSPELQKQFGSKSSPPAAGGNRPDPVGALATTGEAGLPVRCGSVIALEHAASAGLLQAVGAPSPLSNNREVGFQTPDVSRIFLFGLCARHSKREMRTRAKVFPSDATRRRVARNGSEPVKVLAGSARVRGVRPVNTC